MKGSAKTKYQHKMEDWENAKSASFCYQELSNKYQRSTFYNILGRLRAVEHLHLTHNELQDLSSYSFPRCEVLNLNNNFLYSFKNLPSIPKIRYLALEDNDIDSFNGLSKLRSSTIEELCLNGNPVTFQINYRPKVFQILTQLKVLDGIPKLQSDLEFQSEEGLNPESSQCVVMQGLCNSTSHQRLTALVSNQQEKIRPGFILLRSMVLVHLQYTCTIIFTEF